MGAMLRSRLSNCRINSTLFILQLVEYGKEVQDGTSEETVAESPEARKTSDDGAYDGVNASKTGDVKIKHTIISAVAHPGR